MPSRKKTQGKARKAAKAEIAAEATRKKEVLDAHLQRLQLQDTDSCVHGYEPPVEAAAEFVKHFLHIFGQVPIEGNPHGVATAASREKYPEVWTSDGKMTVIKSLFLAVGTNCIVSGDIDLARQCASCANYFKSFIEDIFQQSRPLSLEVDKNIELFMADEHTLVRYFQKHIPCPCLDGKYKEVKRVKKLGFCSNPQCKIPDRMAERSAMLYCQRCRQANYCSRECQEDHWRAGHKERCEEMRNERKAYKSSQKILTS
mmetsp:Transcript_4929/g.7206  ORF Transcript_4929/g.7206 Transcript_4929/m.7206 type:complete len:258 (-) Transcript_4929:161-934(-)